MPAAAAARPTPAQPVAPSIAILPFLDLSDNGSDAYLADGLAEQVLAIRRRASLVRIAAGLPAGKIRVKAHGDGPDVSWECAFAGEAEHAADLAARAKSAEFEAVRRDVRAVIERFERCVERDTGMGEAHWSGERDLIDLAIVPEEIRFRAGDLELDEARWTVHRAGGRFPA